MTIPYGRQALDCDDVTAVTTVLGGDWLTQGPAIAGFEKALAEVCEVPHAVAFSSGTAALHAAAVVAGLRPGDDLVTSAITFAASANCGVYVGASPRFADIDPKSWNMSADSLAAVLTPATRVVVPVHFAGLPAPIEAIREVVGDDVTVVEDAAHALGARTQGERVGACTHSDMAVFSFHPVKAVTTGEGGAVTTRDPELRERLLEFRNHGFTKEASRLGEKDPGGWYYEQQSLGFNYRLTDIQAALGASQLRKLERFIERRNRIADRYRQLLADVEELELPPRANGGAIHAYHLFVVLHRKGAGARRRLYDRLRDRGIFTQVHYIPVYHHPYYRERFGYVDGLCANAEHYYERCLSLPCYPALSEEKQDEVVMAVRECV